MSDQIAEAPRALRWLFRTPGLRVLALASRNYIRHESGNQAGHVAFSTVVALFPFALFLSAAASFLGEPGAAAELVRTLSEFAPTAVVETLQPVVSEVLETPSRTVLTVGLIGALWAASSGAQAIRIALNRAYGVERKLNFWKARLKAIVFTVIGAAAVVFTISSVVVLPYLAAILPFAPGNPDYNRWLWIGARYGVAYTVLAVVYAMFYLWLPDVSQRLRTVLPGALLGPLIWLGIAALFAVALRGAGELTPVYGSFAGVVATLVFLYMSAASVIYGGEINAVLGQLKPAHEGSQPGG